MAVIDLAGAGPVLRHDCWFPAELNGWLAKLTSQERSDAESWINAHVFDAALTSKTHRMNVTVAVRTSMPNPPSWEGSALQPLYDRTGQDDDRARLFYGNLVCRIGVGRPETWWRFSEPVAEDRHSSTYILNRQIAAVANAH